MLPFCYCLLWAVWLQPCNCHLDARAGWLLLKGPCWAEAVCFCLCSCWLFEMRLPKMWLAVRYNEESKFVFKHFFKNYESSNHFKPSGISFSDLSVTWRGTLWEEPEPDAQRSAGAPLTAPGCCVWSLGFSGHLGVLWSGAWQLSLLGNRWCFWCPGKWGAWFCPVS